MKIRYRDWLTTKWKETNFENLKKILEESSPQDVFEVRQICEHKNTWVDGGEEICKRCQQHLRVTTFRD